MTEGYKPIFDAAQELSAQVDYTSVFPRFHDYPDLFHFIVAPNSQYGPDTGALEMAENIDPIVYENLISKGPSKIGNGSETLDGVESRHILLMTYLISTLGINWVDVVEIGGGYGNCFRLVSDSILYDKWSIIDMRYILSLQKWFLVNTNTDIRKVSFIADYNKAIWETLNPHIVIGTHSLSEFSLDDFKSYYDGVIKKANWFFYASGKGSPSSDLLHEKLKIIFRDFTVHSYKDYEGGTSIMFLFRNLND